MEFKGKHWKKEFILTSVRWYLAYPLSYRQVEEMLKERGLEIDHSTVQRWVVEYSPKLLKNFSSHKKQVGTSWCMDETYIKVKGKWVYLYRAVDTLGQTIDFYLSKRRDAASAKHFFQKAIHSYGKPEKVNIDKSSSNTAALNNINRSYKPDHQIQIRQNKYLNKMIEQDHRFIKKKCKPMLGFFSFKSARATLAGIELHYMLRKGQYKFKSHSPVWEQFRSLAG